MERPSIACPRLTIPCARSRTRAPTLIPHWGAQQVEQAAREVIEEVKAVWFPAEQK